MDMGAYSAASGGRMKSLEGIMLVVLILCGLLVTALSLYIIIDTIRIGQ
jgi:hypothetical protein